MHTPLGAHITRINPGHTTNQSEPCTCIPAIQYSVDICRDGYTCTCTCSSMNAHRTGCVWATVDIDELATPPD